MIILWANPTAMRSSISAAVYGHFLCEKWACGFFWQICPSSKQTKTSSVKFFYCTHNIMHRKSPAEHKKDDFIYHTPASMYLCYIQFIFCCCQQSIEQLLVVKIGSVRGLATSNGEPCPLWVLQHSVWCKPALCLYGHLSPGDRQPYCKLTLKTFPKPSSGPATMLRQATALASENKLGQEGIGSYHITSIASAPAYEWNETFCLWVLGENPPQLSNLCSFLAFSELQQNMHGQFLCLFLCCCRRKRYREEEQEREKRDSRGVRNK